MFKNRKIICMLLVICFIIISILLFWHKDRNSTYSEQNKLDTAISKIIDENSNHKDVRIEKIKYLDSKIALYYSYGNSDDKQYAVGLFKKTLFPPYIKMIYLSYSDNSINQSREPLVNKMSKNINILLFYNKNSNVKKIKLRFEGKPVIKTNEYIDIADSEIYFSVIEMKNNGSVYFDNFFDKNNKAIIPQ